MTTAPMDLPEAFESERLLLRTPRPGDGAVANAAILESIAELQPWLPWADPAPTVEQTEEFARKSYVEFLSRKNFALFLFLKNTGEFAGGGGLHPRDWTVPRFEIGYWRRTRCRERGLMREAVLTITRFAFEYLGALRLEIHCDARNYPSACVALGAGYRLEGRLRQDTRRSDGTLRDTLIYGRIPEDAVPGAEPPLEVAASEDGEDRRSCR